MPSDNYAYEVWVQLSNPVALEGECGAWEISLTSAVYKKIKGIDNLSLSKHTYVCVCMCNE